MSEFMLIQLIIFTVGACFLVIFSFYVESLDKKGSEKKEPYLRVLKILIVVFSLWFIFSGFYTKFFTGIYNGI